MKLTNIEKYFEDGKVRISKLGKKLVKKEKKFLFEVKKPRKTWYKASLIRCVAIAKPKPIIKGNISYKNIYDDKESF